MSNKLVQNPRKVVVGFHEDSQFYNHRKKNHATSMDSHLRSLNVFLGLFLQHPTGYSMWFLCAIRKWIFLGQIGLLRKWPRKTWGLENPWESQMVFVEHVDLCENRVPLKYPICFFIDLWSGYHLEGSFLGIFIHTHQTFSMVLNLLGGTAQIQVMESSF